MDWHSQDLELAAHCHSLIAPEGRSAAAAAMNAVNKRGADRRGTFY
jgi:hypothetical protein